MINLSDIVKAYDVRGIVPDELNPEVARALGAAFVTVTGVGELAAGHDMRESGPQTGHRGHLRVVPQSD
ncbi:MAG: phosphomannomutase [Pseudonocardiales bacterium]|nr:phosphomannomutase [Pseudonocardiales bacterium]